MASSKPDHFIALRINHKDIHASIAAVQASITNHSPNLSAACVEPITAHITLGVLRLDTEESKQAAIQGLHNIKQKLTSDGINQSFPLTLQGMGHFRHQVLYIDVDINGKEKLMQLRHAVHEHFSDLGLIPQQGSTGSFSPHVTVAKTSKLMNNKKKSNNSKDVDTLDKDKTIVEEDISTAHEKDTGSPNTIVDTSLSSFNTTIGTAKPGAATTNSSNQRSQSRRFFKHMNRKIPDECYKEHQDIIAGVIECSEIQLCAMQGRQQGEYYHVLATCSFGNVDDALLVDQN